jgi:hypothetical protein
MPRAPSGKAMTGTQRIARYRERQRLAGRVMVWSDQVAPTSGLPITWADPQGLIAHWTGAIKTLRTVQRAAKTWWRASEKPDQAERWASLDADIVDEIERIAQCDLSIFRKNPIGTGRASRWQNATSELRSLLDGYQQWYDNLPETILTAGTELVSKLEAIAELDEHVSELENADLPLGWGRD